MSKEALQIAEKRREVKSKGERERCIQLNAEFQRIARREKKAFLKKQKKQRKTIEQGGLQISSRKLEISREYFMQGWAQWKDRNGMELIETEDIKKKWQEYTD